MSTKIMNKIGQTTVDLAQIAAQAAQLNVSGNDEMNENTSYSDYQNQLYRDISFSDLTDEEKEVMYAELVSDNYSSKNDVKTYSDGVDIDVSETDVLHKTKLSGKFVKSDSNGVDFDDFGSKAKNGDTKDVCGGTITYKGKGNFGELISANPDNGFFSTVGDLFTGKTKVAGTDKARGTIVHYEGTLGSFDYNTRDWELSYYSATENGNEINVPVLHYVGDNRNNKNLLGQAANGSDTKKGEAINIPDGIKICDYMFDSTSITSMPKLPNSIESAHCMFKNCKSMTKACSDAVDHNGNLLCPSNLQDISWMFAGSNTTKFFGELGENIIDGRCAAQDCTNLGMPSGKDDVEKLQKKEKEYDELVESGNDTGDVLDAIKSTSTFMMPDLSKARYLHSVFANDMFDNCPTSVIAIISDNVSKDENGKLLISEWVDVDGAHNSIYAKTTDGSYNASLDEKVKSVAGAITRVKLSDPNGQGVTGVMSDSAGLATSAIHVTDEGNIVDSSTWAVLRQTDKTFEFSDGNSEVFDRGAAFLGTFGLTSGVLKGVTKSKWISLVGGLAVATIPQVVGTANKITPLLDTVAGFVGKDNKVGQFLTSVSDKLKGSNVTYKTPVRDLDIDNVFEQQQKSSVKFVDTQIKDSLLNKDIEFANDTDAYAAGMFVDTSTIMKKNGANLANDGNLITIALTDEDTLHKNLNTALMETAMSGLSGNLREDAGATVDGDGNVISAGSLSDDDKARYSDYYMLLMKNLDAYSQGALDAVNKKYIIDPDNKDKAMNGLSKVMRNTSESVYESMYEMQQTYGLFTEEQIQKLDSYKPVGMPKFSEYTGEDITPEDADKYVNALSESKLTLKEQIEAAKSSEEYQSAYTNYYENAYGYLIDEAEKHNVKVAKTVETPEFATEDLTSTDVGNRETIDVPSNSSTAPDVGPEI